MKKILKVKGSILHFYQKSKSMMMCGTLIKVTMENEGRKKGKKKNKKKKGQKKKIVIMQCLSKATSRLVKDYCMRVSIAIGIFPFFSIFFLSKVSKWHLFCVGKLLIFKFFFLN